MPTSCSHTRTPASELIRCSFVDTQVSPSDRKKRIWVEVLEAQISSLYFTTFLNHMSHSTVAADGFRGKVRIRENGGCSSVLRFSGLAEAGRKSPPTPPQRHYDPEGYLSLSDRPKLLLICITNTLSWKVTHIYFHYMTSFWGFCELLGILVLQVPIHF